MNKENGDRMKGVMIALRKAQSDAKLYEELARDALSALREWYDTGDTEPLDSVVGMLTEAL